MYFASVPVHVAVLPIGSNQLTSDIASGLKVAYKEAEDLKIAGVYKNKVQANIVKQWSSTVLEALAVEIGKSDFGQLIKMGVVFCGGGALTEGLVEQAESTLRFPARIGRMSGFYGLNDELSSPGFATAAGLIMYGLSDSLIEISGSSRTFDKHYFNQVLKRIREFSMSLIP